MTDSYLLGPKDGPVWHLQAHTEAKHEILRSYLGGWYAKLGLWDSPRRIIYLDGFAGPGIYAEGEEGSPVIALRTLLDHKSRSDITRKTELLFLFNEQNAGRAAILRDVLADLEETYGGWGENVKVVVEKENFDTFTDGILDSLSDRGANLAPTFAFVDPFGYRDVTMDKLRRLLSFRSCELFIYFDFNSTVRFATAGNVDHHLEPLFGTDEYRSAPPSGDPGRGPFLLELYERQLREIAGFPYVQAFAMVNEQGRTGNYMIFCSRHLDGLDLMKRAMWSVDPTGRYRFEDRFAGHDVLVGLDMKEAEPLKDDLMRQFGGLTTTIEEIEHYVLTQTPFHIGHIRRKTLTPLQKAEMVFTDQTRKGAFPARCQVTFV